MPEASRGEVLQKLYILFGERFLYPQTPEDNERMRLINIFLINYFKSLDTLSLENIDTQLKALRIKRIEKIRTSSKK